MLTKSKFIVFFLQFCLLDGIAGQLNVTLAVFSGLPDPQWTLFPSNPDFAKIQKLLAETRNKKLTYSPVQMPPRLGYKGFLIQGLTQKNPELIIGAETVKLQQLLFKTLPTGWLQDQSLKTKEFLGNVANKEINPGKIKAVGKQQQLQLELLLQQQQQQQQNATRQKRYAYQFTPISWNLFPKQQQNNCYNYANNKATDTYAQPGRGSGERCVIMYHDCVRNAALNDHLENLETDPAAVAPVPKAPNGKKHLVALAVDPGVDYHWYRLDQSGAWSHKIGTAPATIMDNLGQIIFDPRMANMAPYQFVCFMYSNRDDVTIA